MSSRMKWARLGLDDWDMNNSDSLNSDEFYEGVYNTWDADGDTALGEDEYAEGCSASGIPMTAVH